MRCNTVGPARPVLFGHVYPAALGSCPQGQPVRSRRPFSPCRRRASSLCNSITVVPADSEFGLGTTPQNHVAFLSGVPNNPNTTAEVLVGSFAAGDVVPFSMKTDFFGTYRAFSTDATSDPSVYQEVWTDRDNSLGLGGSAVESLGEQSFPFSPGRRRSQATTTMTTSSFACALRRCPSRRDWRF